MKLLSTFLFIIGFYIKFVNSNPHQQYTCPANCVDVWGDCQDYVQFCQDPKKGPVVRSKCPCTCQVCSPPPTLAPSTTTSTMKPTTKPLLERYKCRPVNIIFVLDNSESIDDAFFNKHIDDFVNDVAGVYPMKGEVRGPSTRVGIVQFGSSANVTYPLIERTRNEFNPRITYSNQGSKNITLGLETALVEFQGQGIGRDENVMVVLVTNVITTLDIQQTSGAVSRVREYSSFFAGVGINGFNGNEISSNLTNLIELIGNKALAFPDIWSAGSYEDGIPPKSLEIYPCKASLCKGVIFIGEMTEVIGQYRKEIFLNSTKQIAAYLDANPGPLSTPEELQFSIAIYGNQTIRPIQLQSFAEFNRDLDILISNVIVNNSPQTGQTRIGEVLNNLYDVVMSDQLKDYLVLFMGQTERILDVAAGDEAAKKLAKTRAQIFVLDMTNALFSNEYIFQDLVDDNPSKIYNYSGQSAADVANHFTTGTFVQVWNQMGCSPSSIL